MIDLICLPDPFCYGVDNQGTRAGVPRLIDSLPKPGRPFSKDARGFLLQGLDFFQKLPVASSRRLDLGIRPTGRQAHLPHIVLDQIRGYAGETCIIQQLPEFH